MNTFQFNALRGSLILIAIFCFNLSMGKVGADDFQGRKKLLERLNVIQQKTGTPAPTQDTFSQLAKDAKAFPQEAAGLLPEDAAKRWLILFDRFCTLKIKEPANEFGGFQNNPATTIFKVLPGPQSWPELGKLVELRKPDPKAGVLPQYLLQLIVHTLNNEEDNQWADLAAISSLAAETSTPQYGQGFDPKYILLMLSDKLSEVANHPEQVEKFWDQTLALVEKAGPNPAYQGQQVIEFQLPDFVTLLGADKAAPLLLRALLLPNTHLNSVAGTETQRVARKVALANIDKLTQPPWSLTENLEGGSLYEALIKKFPNDSASQAGATYYLISLVVEGKPDEAIKAVATINPASLNYALDKAVDAGWGMQVYDFLHGYLASHPESTLWSSYIDIAAQTSHAAEALELVQQAMARPDLSKGARIQIQPVLYRALLAVDKVEEGVAQLRDVIKSAKANGPLDPGNSVYNYNTESQPVDLDLKLARIGHLLQHNDWENEGLNNAQEVVRDEGEHLSLQTFSIFQAHVNTVASFLMETGRNVEAEKFLMDAIVLGVKQKELLTTSKNISYAAQGFTIDISSLLTKLAFVYYNAGRWHDILVLLENASGWQAQDLVNIASTRPEYGENYPTPCLGLMAAQALAETGRLDQARTILDYVLHIDSGSDAAYALLLKIGQGDLAAKLDTLYQQDQFQERPLIWKGTLLLQQGKVAEAEQACKAAIAVDPSDGEEGKGDRMRVYSVMADVCDAKHDPQQATFFRNVMKAIRLSENADDYYGAGLLTRAVNMYNQALTLFSDAYCIQSRIARQLAELGRMDEAAVHYRKAFELMPVSFGRMESHCFGCERAFKGHTATEIAEKTFKDMAAKDPTKPQLYYLLGYLYMEQERYPESVANFQKAAELDPDYINAWKNIIEIGENYQLSPNLRDEAVFNVIRLDPAGRHITPNIDKVRQLAKLWQVEETAAKIITPPPSTLYVLTASAKAQEKQVDQFEKMLPTGIDADMRAQILEQLHAQWPSSNGTGTTPIDAILGNGVLSTCLQGE